MNETEIRAVVLKALARIAPEAGAVDPAGDLREQVDLDSMDFLNFVTGAGKELGVEVPEADYPRLATLDGCVAYFAARAAQPAQAG